MGTGLLQLELLEAGVNTPERQANEGLQGPHQTSLSALIPLTMGLHSSQQLHTPRPWLPGTEGQSTGAPGH